MPGSWDDSNPTYEATKGTGISSNPAVQTDTGTSAGPISSEAARGSGISSAIGSESTYSAATGSHTAPEGQRNPDALAAASSALHSSPASASRGQATTNTVGLGSKSSAFGSKLGGSEWPLQGNTNSAATGQSVSQSATGTSSTGLPTGSALGSSQGSSNAPIADSFTSGQKSAGTEYVGSSAPGVSGQSVPHDAPFSTSNTSTSNTSSALGTGVLGATAGGLTGQSIADRTRGTEGTSAVVEPSYTERAQQLPGSATAGSHTTATADKLDPTLGGSSSTGTTSGTSAALGGISSGGTKVSQPFASDPVSTEPLGSSSNTATEAGHYTGDSRDYNPSSNTGLGSSNTASGEYTGSAAPGVSGQSVPHGTGTASSATDATSQHHYGRDAAAVAGVGGAGALGAHEYSKHGQSSDLASGSDPSSQGRKSSKVGALINELDILPKKQESRFHGSTGPGHTAKDEYYGGQSGSADNVGSGTANSGNTARNVAAGVGAGAIGAGGVGAYEASKSSGSGVGNTSTSGVGTSSTTAGQPTSATGGVSTTGGYGDKYDHLASGTPSGISAADPALGGSSSQTPQTGNTSTNTGIGSATGTSGSDHHYGRDAALGGGVGAAAVGTGLAANEARKDKDLPTAQDKRETAQAPDTYTQQVATAEAPYENKPYYIGDSLASHTKQAPQYATPAPLSSESASGTAGTSHSGRDAAVLGGAGAAGAAGVYGASKAHDTSATGQSGLTSGAAAPSAGGSSSQGYGDQYKHLAGGTPSGISTSDPAFKSSGVTSSPPQGETTGQQQYGRDGALGGAGVASQGETTGQQHHGRDAALGGAGIAGTGAAAYGLTQHQKESSGVGGATNTAGTTTSTTTSTTTNQLGHGKKEHAVPPVATGSHHHDENDEPDSPTGTGETKKKRGFLSKLLHRDDPNKLHKEPGRKSLDANGADVPKTTHAAYGGQSTAEGGKDTHIGTDGVIGEPGQKISGYGGLDAREAHPLPEAEEIVHHQGTALGGSCVSCRASPAAAGAMHPSACFILKPTPSGLTSSPRDPAPSPTPAAASHPHRHPPAQTDLQSPRSHQPAQYSSTTSPAQPTTPASSSSYSPPHLRRKSVSKLLLTISPPTTNAPKKATPKPTARNLLHPIQHQIHQLVEPLQHAVHLAPAAELDRHLLVRVLGQVEDVFFLRALGGFACCAASGCAAAAPAASATVLVGATVTRRTCSPASFTHRSEEAIQRLRNAKITGSIPVLGNIFATRSEAPESVVLDPRALEHPGHHSVGYRRVCDRERRVGAAEVESEPNPCSKTKGAVQPHLISLCPTMDLVAAVTAPNQLEVFRFDGQRAFGWRRGTAPLKITALRWSDSGAYIAIAWDDDKLEVIDAKLGKVVLQNTIAPPKLERQNSEGTQRRITFLGWGTNLLDANALNAKTTAKRTAVTRPVDTAGGPLSDAARPTLEDYTTRVPDRRLIDAEGEAADLPRQLAFIDVENELPQLSALPQVEDALVLDFQADRFSSQELIDTRLPMPDDIPGAAASVDVQLACGDDIITSFIYGGFLAGDKKLGSNTNSSNTVVAHASHPFSTRHVLLKQSQNSQQPVLVQMVDYVAINQSKHFLQLVHSKVSSILELSRYISQTIVCLRAAWKACQDLPQRWISNGREMLEERHKTDIIPALYSLAVTGDCLPALKEWLTDDIGERNHKRWDAAVTSNYTKITELVQRNLLPALDRATVVASRLRALSRTPNIPVFKIDERHLTRVMSDIDVLRFIAYRVLQHARTEARQFAVFSSWLAVQVVLQAAEPVSSTAHEQAERAAEIDPAPLLTYILEGLTRSRLNVFLARPSAEVVDAPRRPQQQIRAPALHRMLDRQEEKLLQPGTERGVIDLGNMLYQALFLRDSVQEVYDVVPAGLSRGTLVDEAQPCLERGLADGPWDIRMAHQPTDAAAFALYVLYTARPDSLALELRAVVPSLPVMRTFTIPAALPSSSSRDKILAAKFLDDQDLVMLVHDSASDSSRLQRQCYTTPSDPVVVKTWEHRKDGFRPRHLCVSKEKARVRLVVLDDGGKRYAVVAFDDGGATVEES
ncbi:hypothetical protein FH972_025035 [Carpinus fangiana]|uniref:Anaphase-promoting complex subunit 4 n=1 Tax=Carpinus fangiana TaxID=176857 RepID=A0A5N6KZV4_9ROSI|nr:hypothetical protein FH972_025035 [Carpinus fangiana]